MFRLSFFACVFFHWRYFSLDSVRQDWERVRGGRDPSETAANTREKTKRKHKNRNLGRRGGRVVTRELPVKMAVRERIGQQTTGGDGWPRGCRDEGGWAVGCQGPQRRRIAVTRGAGCMFRFFRSKKVACCVFLQNHCVCRRHDNLAGRHYARRHRAVSDMLHVTCKWRYFLSFLGPPWSQWCSDWCALGGSAIVAFGCVCSSHVSGWLMSVEVFAVVPLAVSCFLSCWVGGYFVGR